MLIDNITKTDFFVREPVDKVNKEILKSDSKRIILTGGRGSGKSTVLYSLENRGLGTEEQTINTRFESVSTFGYTPSENIINEIYRHKYELSFCFKLLAYIKNNYPFIYEKEFKDIYEVLDEMSFEFVDAINNGIFESYKQNNFSQFLETMSIAKSLVERIRNILEVEKLNLSIDRFDWTNNSSKLSQQILSEYFPLFDKVILTSDDDVLNLMPICNYLINYKDYDIQRLSYGGNLEIVKIILQRHIAAQERFKYFDINNITDNVVRAMINESSNNISCMIMAIENLAEMNNYYKDMYNLENQAATIINEKVRRVRELKERSVQKRFYL